MAEFLKDIIVALQGDITQQRVDAIVNAANGSLLGGGGVDGAIHRAGGPAILEECRELRATSYRNGLPVGESVITTPGLLPAKAVIHTVGPVYGMHDGREADLLAACYRNSLALAMQLGFQTIAFPAISTGIFGYPKEEAAVIASTAILKFMLANAIPKEVRLIFYNESDLSVFLQNHRFTDSHRP